MNKEEVSVEDVEDPEIEALPGVETQRAGGADEFDAVAGAQDHYQDRLLQSLARWIKL
jgi:hypothetical protein